jgi:large subunit ribosomal protein L3
MGMPGHLGDERVTVQNLRVMQVREAEKIILVSGAVPGANGSYVVVRPAIKNPGARLAAHEAHAKADAAALAKKPKKAGEIAQEKAAAAKEASRK